jgi:O-antigen/teichoic acid export membrane protein
LETGTEEVPRRVWSGTALQVLGRFFGAACTLGILYLTAESLVPAAFGRFTFYLAVFAWLDSLANLGTGPVAVQRTAGHPERVAPVLAAARRIRLGAASLGVLLVGGGALLAREPGAGWIVLATLYPLTHALELSLRPFRHRISWGVPVLIRAASHAVSFALVALCYAAGRHQPALYLVAVALGSATGNVLMHLAARRHLPRPPPSGRPVVPERGLLNAALPLGISAMCAQTYFYVDNLFVRALVGEEELGHYNVAVRFMSWTIMLAQYVTYTALPWLTQRHLAGALGPAIGRLGPPLMALAGLGCGLLVPWTGEMLEVFQPGFGAAGPSLQWLFAATVAIYAGAMFATAVVATGNMLAMLWIAAAGVVVNAAGNAFAVPLMGIEGAGMVTFLTEVFVALASAAVLRRGGVRPGPVWRWLGGPVLFGVGAWLSSLLPLG